MQGRIHSFQSMGTLDGPGLRFIVFFSGCPLRCAFCHNPDTWTEGSLYTADKIVKKALRFRTYFGADGGVTLSGGEVLSQPEFAAELLSSLKESGIKTAIDTSGIGDPDKVKLILQYTDLVICDIKFPGDSGYRKYCGGSLGQVKDFLSLCEKMSVPLWIRQVIIPGITDSEESMKKTLQTALGYSNLERIELLPFKKLCLEKYERLGISFPLANTPECPAETIAKLTKLIPGKYR